ncbi:hypothetical protein ACU70A_07210 [Syntrophomonas erecta subsp. sporosyntropha]
MLALAITAFVIIMVLDLPELLKKGLHREIAVFAVLMLVGIYGIIAQLYDWPLYNPFPAIIERLGR